MPLNLILLETRLKTLIEGSVSRFFPTARQRVDLSVRLATAFHQGIQRASDGVFLAPNLFTILVHPAQYRTITANPGILENLAHVVSQIASESGVRLVNPPTVRIAASPQLAMEEIQVLAENSLRDLTDTSDLEVEELQHPKDVREFPTGAFLIVDGIITFPITQPIINIGRRSDNTIVIEDVRVSRQHAQIRAIRGRFIIFDLGSTGGTWVNGKLVQQSVLLPGDVISLAGVPIVFGQENLKQNETQTMNPISSDPLPSSKEQGAKSDEP